MKKNGFTIIELITSFALASVIMIFIFNIVMILKDNYISKSMKTDLIIKQSLLSQKINEDFVSNNIVSIATCTETSKNCYDIKFEDNTSKRLTITNNGNTIKYGDYTYTLNNNSYTDKVNAYIEYIDVADKSLNNSFLVIEIPILNKKFPKDNFGIKVIYQFNSNIYNISI